MGDWLNGPGPFSFSRGTFLLLVAVALLFAFYR